MSTPDDITIEYEENGQILVKQLDKAVLSKGLWVTVLFRYQELIQDTGEYGAEKYSIRRYKKKGGDYVCHSKFTISSVKQAREIAEVLGRWIGETA